MSMILESGEACPFSNKCSLNSQSSPCFGARSDRMNKFECEYVVNGSLITDSGYRNPLDQTGKMKLIME